MLEKCLKGICCLAMFVLLIGCGESILTSLHEEAGIMSHRSRQRKDSVDIPRIYLEGDIEGMQEKTDVREVCVKYQDGDRVVSAYAKLKVQGDFSLMFEKKNYSIKLYQNKNFARRKKVDFGWGNESQYCLKANSTDKTQARNIVSARLAAEIQEKYNVLEMAPNHGLTDGYPVEVYNNDKFLGVYTLNIPKDDWLFGMDGDNKNHLVFYAHNWTLTGLFEELPDYDSWRIEVGEETDANMEKLSHLFEFVINSTDEEFCEHFSQYLDLDATMTYFILANLGMMLDNCGKNMLLASYDGKLWYPCLYDMDISWGLLPVIPIKLNDYYTEFPVLLNTNRLLRRVQENFPEELAQRYFELRESILTQEHIMQMFYDFSALIPEQSVEREREKWGDNLGFDYDKFAECLDGRLPAMDAYMREHEKWKVIPDVDYDQIEEYLNIRLPAMDAYMAELQN